MSTSRVDVGTPPDNFKDWATTNVCFHGFANLTTTREEFVESPVFVCSGFQWVFRVYPGGRANSDEGNIAIGLCNMSNTSIKLHYGFSVRNRDGEEVVNRKLTTKEFSGAQFLYRKNFAKRSTIMDILVDGSFVIEIRMKCMSTDNKSIAQFIPTNPFNKNVLELFMNEETADVVFEVDNGSCQSEENTNKKTKTTTTFHAHRPILLKCAPTLYEMCGVSGEGGITTVSITDVKPDIFKHMLYYSYGGKLSDEDLKENAKGIINACDKYGVVHLKLEAEACYVELTKITMDNMMDNLLYADSKNLALLKEAVMDYIVANKRDILGKVSFDNVPGGTVSDVLAAVSRHWGEDTEDGGEEESIKYNTMRVGTLRKMLDEKGLDVDGSRESMIALLKEHDK